MDSGLWAFTGIVALLTITPGADTMLVVRNVLARGPQAGLFAALGVCAGLFFHAACSALGLSLILAQSAMAFTVVKWLGALYLIYLGVQSLLAARHAGTLPGVVAAQAARPAWRSFGEGIVTNVLNPKVAVFYLAFLPQFIAPGDPVLLRSLTMAGIHFLLGIVWLSLVTLLLRSFRSLLLQPRARQILESVTGLLLIGFGIRLALEHRPG